MNNFQTVEDPFSRHPKQYTFSLNNESENNRNIDENCDFDMKRYELSNTLNDLADQEDDEIIPLLINPNQLVDKLRKLYETSVGKEMFQIVKRLRNAKVIE